MAESYDISGLNQKIENEGATSQGRLSAAEFNLLVNAAIESQERLAELENYFVPITETEYEQLIEDGTIEDRPYFVYEE